MSKINIAAVEYINTLPFLYGLSYHFHPDAIAISSANPAKCAELYTTEKVDIALVPIGALDSLGEHEIITNYCIGSKGRVDTVALLSKVPIDKIKTISLDADSRTSAILIQILCSSYWNINPVYTSENGSPSTQDSRLLIGDKVKKLEDQFQFKYDLGHAWHQLTSLPMVYAVWVARPHIKSGLIDELNAAFRFAINNLQDIPLNGQHNAAYWRKYIRESIQYELGELEKKGMNLFFDYCKKLNL